MITSNELEIPADLVLLAAGFVHRLRRRRGGVFVEPPPRPIGSSTARQAFAPGELSLLP
jgi:hypothetical protein